MTIVLKVTLVTALIYWLISSGKLSLAELKIFYTHPSVAVYNILLWMISLIFLCGLRWNLLLKGVGIHAKLSRSISLTAIGAFFNSVMPGAVGGDLIKALYITKDHSEKSKSRIAITLLLDRILGITGLLFIAVLGILLNAEEIFAQKNLKGIATIILLLFSGISLFFATIFLSFTNKNDPIEKLLSFKIPLLSIFKNIYLAFREYHHHKQLLFKGFLSSVLSQGLFVIFFWYITTILSGQNLSITNITTIVPIGILTTAIPLAPGGLGVGHAAFDQLFSYIGISGGANIFNVAFLGQMTLNLLGIIPYLLLKSKK